MKATACSVLLRLSPEGLLITAVVSDTSVSLAQRPPDNPVSNSNQTPTSTLDILHFHL